MAIKDLITVPEIETVIQLMSVESERAGQGEALLRSFVFTEEVERGFAQVFSRLREGRGCGIFLKGNYGSGKSHFLAFLSLILEADERLAEVSHPIVAEYFSQRMAPFLGVRVALHQHPATRHLEDILWEAIEKKAGRVGGEPLLLRSATRLVDQFNRYLLPQHPEFLDQIGLGSNEWVRVCRDDPEKAAKWICSFMETLQEDPLKVIYDRKVALEKIMDFIEQRRLEGLFLFVDELSEFLKSKPSPASFNEDIRFLQLLGEGFRNRPAWIIAALQENIESSGYLEKDLVLRIKDRFPVRIGLTAHHVGELIGSRLVKKRPGAEPVIKGTYDRFSTAYPRANLPWQTFLALYPVHPRTVSFLEGLTDLFSQHRGVVDFIFHQLTGDANRNWPGMMDLDEKELLTPDAIFDHFRERIRENPDLISFVDVIYRGLARDVQRLFADEQERRLALKAIKILILVEFSPLERRLGPEELAPMLNEPISELDEQMNVRYLADVILDTMVREAEFLHKETNQLGVTVYYVSEEKSPHQQLKNRIKDLILERPLTADDFAVLSTYLTQPILPLATIAEASRRRYQFEWQGTTRHGYVTFHASTPSFQKLMSLEHDLQTTEADFFLLILRPDPEGKEPVSPASLKQVSGRMSHAILVWLPQPFDGGELTFMHTFCAYHLTREALRKATSREEKALLPLVDEWLKENQNHLKEIMLDAYLRGEMWSQEGRRSLSGADFYPRFSDLLKQVFSGILESLFPHHARVMPLDSIQSYTSDRLFDAFLRPGTLTLEEARAQHLLSALEAFLAPLGLVKRTEDAFVLNVDPENSPLIQEILDGSQGESPGSLYSLYWSFRKGKWGLTRPFFELVLSALLITGRLSAFRSGMPVRFRSLKQLSDGSIDGVGRGALLSEPTQAALLDFFSDHEPGLFEGTFSLSVQEGMWKALKPLRDEVEGALETADSLASSYASYPAFQALDRSLFPDKELLQGFIHSVRVSYPAIKGLETVFESLGGQGLKRLATEIKRLRAWILFLRTQFPDYNGYYMYLSDPTLGRMAETEHFPLGREYQHLVKRILEPSAPYGPDTFQKITHEFHSFKDRYIRFYADQHRDYYSSEVFKEKGQLEKTPVAQVLKKLYQVEALRGGKDWIDFQRQLSRLPTPCRQQPEITLAVGPHCSCGFVPSRQPPKSSSQDLKSRAMRGVRDILRQLTSELRWPLESYILGLEEAGDRPAATALRQVLAIPLNGLEHHIDRLNHLLTRETLEHIGKALAGKVLVVRRSLESLIGVLTEKRMTLGDLRTAFEDWLLGEESPDDSVLVRLEREQAIPFDQGRYRALDWVILEEGNRFYEAFWLAAWAMQHKALGFTTWVSDRYRYGQGHEAAMEEALKRPEIREDGRQVDLYLRGQKLLDSVIGELCHFQQRTNEELMAIIKNERLLESVSLEACRELGRRLSPKDPVSDALLNVVKKPREEAPVWPHLKTLFNGIQLLGLADRTERTPKNRQVAFYLKEGWQIEAGFDQLLEDQSSEELFPPQFLERLGRRLRPYSRGVACDRSALVSQKSAQGIIPMEALEEHLIPKLSADLLPQTVVLIVDGMRWDVWEALREPFGSNLPHHRLSQEGALLAAIPSTTETNRHLILKAFSGLNEPFFFPTIESPGAFKEIAPALEDRQRPVILNIDLVDGLLHTIKDPIPTLIRMVKSRFGSLLLAVLAALPGDRPLAILADHGFIRMDNGEYSHGGNSLQELLVPYSLWLPDPALNR